jgi:hypothetical protein
MQIDPITDEVRFDKDGLYTAAEDMPVHCTLSTVDPISILESSSCIISHLHILRWGPKKL